MGFYIRKSKKVGPFRLNLSKSGLGLSFGVKGLRISTGPNGTYLNAGRKGVYYRTKIGGKSSSSTSGGSLKERLDDRLQNIESDDDILIKIIYYLVNGGECTTSNIQREFKLGYSRAARYIDKLEEMGVVGPYVGASPRKVLLTMDDIRRINAESNNENDAGEKVYDDLIPDAIEAIIDGEICSVDMIRDSLDVSLEKATLLYDQLAELDFISNEEENGYRKVLITRDDWYR